MKFPFYNTVSLNVNVKLNFRHKDEEKCYFDVIYVRIQYEPFSQISFLDNTRLQERMQYIIKTHTFAYLFHDPFSPNMHKSIVSLDFMMHKIDFSHFIHTYDVYVLYC